MNGQRLTDAQIATALRAHLPAQAAPVVRDRVMDSIATTSQQRQVPWVIAGLVDADPIGRRQSLVIAATLLLALALAGVAAAGAMRLQQQDADPLLNVEPPADLPAFARSAYDNMPELAPVAITSIEDGSVKRRIYVDASGAVRIERYATLDATQPDTYEILNGTTRGQVSVVGSDRVWVQQDDAIGEDPRVFVYATLAAATFGGISQPGCEVAVSPGETFASVPGTGWRYVGVEYVAGRLAHHLTCSGDLWIDAESRVVLRSRGPVLDGRMEPVPGAFRTIEVTEIAFGDQPSELFVVAPPHGVAQITPEQECALDPSCSATAVPAYVPPAGSTPAPASPFVATHPSNGWVAFTTYSSMAGGAADIFLVRDGHEPQLIAGGDYGHGRNSCPTFSPDGSRLAYAQDDSIVIVGVDADGRRVEPETRISVPGADGPPCPVWSPDGRSVAYTFVAENGFEAIAVADAVSGSTVVLASDDATGRIAGEWLANWSELAWSPTGDAIAAREGGGGIYLVPIDGGDPTLLREGQLRGTRWSPDGSRIAVTTSDGGGGQDVVRIIRVDGTEADIDLGPGEEPVWSPTGDRLAYTAQGKSASALGPVVVVDADGSNARGAPALSDEAPGAASGAAPGAPGLASGVTWSPDGTQLLFVGFTEEGLYAPVAVPVAGGSAPIVFAPPTMHLYAARTRDLAWQPAMP